MKQDIILQLYSPQIKPYGDLFEGGLFLIGGLLEGACSRINGIPNMLSIFRVKVTCSLILKGSGIKRDRVHSGPHFSSYSGLSNNWGGVGIVGRWESS